MKKIATRIVHVEAERREPFKGTRITVVAIPKLEYGIYSAKVAAGSTSVKVDWGDGTVETLAAISRLVHTYPHPGLYEIRISDDIEELGLATVATTSDYAERYSPMVECVFSDAAKIKALSAYSLFNAANMHTFDMRGSSLEKINGYTFSGASGLRGRIDLPNVSQFTGKGTMQPFKDCTGLTEIHFSKSNEALVTAWSCYKADPRLGAANAVVMFD